MSLNTVTLRLASGSLPKVDRVHAFDPATRRASVKFKGPLTQWLETVSLDELEAFTADRRYVDVESIVRRMAKEILPPL